MMSDDSLIARYNYDEFIPEKFEPWLNFSNSPSIGYPAPDFPLWPLDGGETIERNLVTKHIYNYRIWQFHLTVLREGDAIHDCY
jgi:hypothetical protein